MKKKTRFLFGAIATTMLAVSVFGGMCLNASAAEITVDEMREHLISMQFPKLYINSISEEKVKHLYGASQTYYISSVERQTSYLSESNDSMVMPMGAISTKDLSFEITTMYWTGDRTDPFLKWITVYIDYEWLNSPKYKKTDAIVVNWDSNVFTYSSDSFDSIDYAETIFDLEDQIVAYKYIQERPTAITQGGLGYDVSLNHYSLSSAKFVKRFYGCAAFDLLPTKSPMYIETNPYAQSFLTTSINAQYAHNWNTFSTSIGFSTSGPSISFATTNQVDTTAISTNIFYNVY